MSMLYRSMLLAFLLIGCAAGDPAIFSSVRLDAATECDQDGDGRAGPQCGGPDCCDIDAETHAGAGAQAEPDACGSFDRSCDGVETPEWRDGHCQSLGTNSCWSARGFITPTACGEVGEFIEDCPVTSAGACGAPTIRMEQQACR